MILKDRLKKIPNNSTLLISNNNQITRDQILDRYKIDLSKISGSRILICKSNISETLPIITAIDGLADSFALISTSTPTELISFFAKSGNFEAILCDATLNLNKIKNIPPIFHDFESLINTFKSKKTPKETRWILTTSGTTGNPKLVSHSLSSLTRTTKTDLKRGSNVRWGMLYDYTRFAGLQVLLQSIISGSALIEPVFNFSLEKKIKNFIEHKCTHLSATPTLWRKILMTPNSSKLTLFQATLGGEIADDRILSAVSNHFAKARIAHIFASTESGVGFSVVDKKAGFPKDYLENPPFGVDIKIENNKLYVRNKEVNNKYLGSEILFASNDGWIDTGDSVEIKNDRVLFRGREDGVINVGGDKVYPEEVENILLKHPLVSAARVYAKSNPITGSLVAADVTLIDQQTDENKAKKLLQEYSVEMLDRHKSLASIKIVPRFNLNSSGKIVREV